MNDIRQKLLSSWRPPGGSCHDEISASRNRYFIVTDEGRRWLKVIDCSAEWWKPKHIPFIQLHSLTNLSPPLISLFYQPVPKCRLIKNPASPRGKPRTQKPLDITIQRATLLRGRRVAKLAHPTDGAAIECGGCADSNNLAQKNPHARAQNPLHGDSFVFFTWCRRCGRLHRPDRGQYRRSR